jgi:fermentation-respiration switch protein FrsA (DUF1100 family)
MFIKIIGIICGVYVAYGLALFSVQRSFMYPRRYAQPLQEPIQIENMEKVWLQTSRGKVEAWYIPAGSPSDSRSGKRPAVLFSHGNGELIDYCVYEFLPYTTIGIDLFLIEYPGYGRSEGRPSQRAITETFTTAYDWLVRNKNVDSTKILAHGRSVGGGVACDLAKKRNIRALILQSTFTDAKQFARGYLLPGFLIRDKFDNVRMLVNFDGPVLIMHGKYDEMIPYKNGVKLSEAAKKSRLVTYNCHHNDCPPDEKVSWDDIKAFLTAQGIID